MILFRFFSSFALLYFGVGAVWFPALASASDNVATATKRIVILGDSITAGYGLNPSLAYPALLQKKINKANLDYKIINAGISGDTTSGGVRRLDWVLGKGADVLMIALGGNDGLRGVASKQVRDNLNAMIQRARAKSPDIQILIAGMQMPGSMGANYAKQFSAIFSEVAEKNKVDLIPFLLDGVGGVEKYNQPDLIHPTAEGQEKIAETVWEVLKPMLKGEGRN